MKTSYLIPFLIFTLNISAQSESFDYYNMSIIDSCMSRIDSSYRFLHIRFVNGKNPEFEKVFIEQLDTLDFIDYFLYENSSQYSEAFQHQKGMSISIYYDSSSCLLNACSASIDPLTFEAITTMCSDDFRICWQFSVGEAIQKCKQR